MYLINLSFLLLYDYYIYVYSLQPVMMSQITRERAEKPSGKRGVLRERSREGFPHVLEGISYLCFKTSAWIIAYSISISSGKVHRVAGDSRMQRQRIGVELCISCCTVEVFFSHRNVETC